MKSTRLLKCHQEHSILLIGDGCAIYVLPFVFTFKLCMVAMVDNCLTSSMRGFTLLKRTNENRKSRWKLLWVYVFVSYYYYCYYY